MQRGAGRERPSAKRGRERKAKCKEGPGEKGQHPPPRTRVKWVPFVLLAFFPCFTVFFASNLAIVPLKRSVLGAWKGHFRARKGQMVDLGFQDPKTTWNAYKTRENVTAPQLASLHGLASSWANNCYKTGKKNGKRTNGTHFARPPVHPPESVLDSGYYLGSMTLYLPPFERNSCKKTDLSLVLSSSFLSFFFAGDIFLFFGVLIVLAFFERVFPSFPGNLVAFLAFTKKQRRSGSLPLK